MKVHAFTKELQEHEVTGDETTNSEYQAHGGSFGTYFRNKQIKLDTQAKERHVRKSEIFAGCVIYITGYTTPSAAVLKQIVVENGGQICAFLGGKSYATHVVATALTHRKEMQMANSKVVKPAWITESAKMGRQLPWTQYRTIRVVGNHFFQVGDSQAGQANKASEVTKAEVNVDKVEIHDTDSDSDDGPPPMEDSDDDEAGTESGETGQTDGTGQTGETGDPGKSDEVDDLEDEDVDNFLSQESSAGANAASEEAPGDSVDLLDTPGPQGDAARRQWIIAQRPRVNCLAPAFIRDYFAKSRLHFLSTSKLELRSRCRAYTSPFPAWQPAGQSRTLLHVDFDSFFVAVAVKKRPDLAERPVCVSHGSDGSDVASCNYVARQHGVANGQWVARARRLCPDLVCLPYDFAEYRRCSDVLYEALLELRPNKVSAVSVDEAMVDVTQLAQSRPVAEIAQGLRDTVRRKTGIAVSVGGGPNVLLAKLALRLAKPDGYSYLSHIGDSTGSVSSGSHLSELPVRQLPHVGPHIVSQLAHLDVRTLGDLQRLSLPQLQSGVGSAMGSRLHGYARGIDTNDISTLDVPVRTVGLEIGWGVRVTSEVEAVEFVEQCALELWRRLAQAGQQSEQLTVRVHVKSPGAAFLVPKYMGHGLCDVPSRSAHIGPSPTKAELVEHVRSLVRRIPCAPLDLRGLGLHIRVCDPVVVEDSRQGKIRFATSPTKPPARASAEPAATPPKKKMVAIPPRRHRAGKTLTQLLRPAETVDLDVFRELPSQIRREILRHEDDYVVPAFTPAGPPQLRATSFYGASDLPGLKTLVKAWVRSGPPKREDAEAFYRYMYEAAQDNSAWGETLELAEWLGLQIELAGGAEWHIVRDVVSQRVQSLVKERLAITE